VAKSRKITTRLILLLVLLVSTVAYGAERAAKKYLFSNFTSGEITRKLDARTDFEKFFNGARELTNMEVFPYGGVFKRPGSKYISGVSNHAEKVRLIPFTFSTTQSYVIEMGAGYARFYMNGGQVQIPDSDTQLLLHCDGVDASTSFTESSTTGYTITANGNAQIDTEHFKFATGSCLLSGTSDYISTIDSANWYFDTDAFTIEAYARFSDVSGQHCLYSQSGTSDYNLFYYDNDQGKLIFVSEYSNARVVLGSASWTPVADTWYNIALIRGWSGVTNTWAFVVDGASIGNFTSTASLPDISGRAVIGSCLGETAVDSGNTGYAFTFYLSAELTTDAAKWGSGSLETDGANAYIETPDKADWDICENATDNQTIDFWVKHADHAGNEYYIEQYESADNRWFLHHEHTKGIEFVLRSGGVNIIDTAHGGEITDTDWHHIVFCKVADEYGIYVDGTQVVYLQDSSADNLVGALLIGRAFAGSVFSGNIDEFRLEHSNIFSAAPNVGKADTITVPTSIHTATSDTALLLHLDTKDWTGNIDEIRISSVARNTTNYAPPESEFPFGDNSGLAYSISTPYKEDALGSLKYTQSADYLYLAHPEYPPYTMTRAGHTDWTGSTISFTSNPFSGTTGYPGCVEFHEQRLCWAGTTAYPQTIFMSKSADYENMDTGTGADDDAIELTIAASQVNAIRWMSSGKILAIGTTGGEWKLGSMESSEPIQPDNVQVKRQTTHGSANIEAEQAGRSLLYVQRSGRKVRNFQYNYEVDGYISNDMSLLAEHLTNDTTIKQIAYQQEPNGILWCVLNDGDLLGLTYLQEHDVYAWHRHETIGNYESIAVIPGNDGSDEIWVVVNRTIGGNPRRFIEVFQSAEFDTLEDCFYVDSGLTYAGSGVTTVSGLDHLIGETVALFGDGVYSGTTVVNASGEVMFSTTVSKATVGLPYTATLETIDLPIGTGLVKKISTLHVRFFKTAQATYGPDTSSLDDISFTESGTTPYTGDVTLDFQKGYDSEQTIVIQSAEPYPFSVSGVLVEIE